MNTPKEKVSQFQNHINSIPAFFFIPVVNLKFPLLFSIFSQAASSLGSVKPQKDQRDSREGTSSTSIVSASPEPQPKRQRLRPRKSGKVEGGEGESSGGEGKMNKTPIGRRLRPR